MPTAQAFEDALQGIISAAQEKDESYVVITSKELHERVGGYPGRNHRMPTCCRIMRKIMFQGDKILYEPPDGQGATLKIRYKLPRKQPCECSRGSIILLGKGIMKESMQTQTEKERKRRTSTQA